MRVCDRIGVVLGACLLAALPLASGDTPRTAKAAQGSVHALAERVATAPPSVANLWVDVSGGACARLATAGAHVDAQACASLNAAYAAASPGDTVLIKGGTYSGQTIAYQASKTSSSDVVFRVAAGESVVFSGQVNVQASHLTIDGGDDADGYIMMRQGLELESRSPASPMREDITIRHVDAMGNQSSIDSVKDVLVYDAYFGGYHKSSGDSLGDDGLRIVQSSTGGTPAGIPQNIMLDHIYVGELGRGDSTPHNDCLPMDTGINITIRNSRFWHCSTQGLYLSGSATAVFDNILIENNWFGPCSTPWQGFVGNKCSDIIVIEWDKRNLTFRFNSIGAPEGWRIGGNGPTTGPILVKGNAGASPGCGKPITSYERNVWGSGQRCSPTDVIAPPRFVAAPAVGSSCTGYDPETKRVTPELCWRIENHAFDYHLSAGSPAIGRAGPEDRRATDIDGQSRPFLSGWDAGSDQREPALIESGKAIGAVRLGMPREAVEKHYGKAVAGRTIAGGLRLANYRARGNRITVYYNAGPTVVGIQTRSRYYSTQAGFGVGSRTSEAVARRLSWVECVNAFRIRGKALTLFHSTGGPTRGRIGLVSIVSPAVELPDLAKRCNPSPSPRPPSRN